MNGKKKTFLWQACKTAFDVFGVTTFSHSSFLFCFQIVGHEKEMLKKNWNESFGSWFFFYLYCCVNVWNLPFKCNFCLKNRNSIELSTKTSFVLCKHRQTINIKHLQLKQEKTKRKKKFRTNEYRCQRPVNSFTRQVHFQTIALI